MKSLYILLAALLVGVAPCGAQSPPTLVFPETEWDFGDIAEDGGPVSHAFGFVNGDKNPVSIIGATASCGCTTPEYPKSPVAAGGRGEVVVTFDPMGYPGEFSKNIAVTSAGTPKSDGRHTSFLVIKGRVIPRKKTVEEEYPQDMGGGVRLDAVFLPFGQIAQGRLVARVIKYVNTSDRPVTLEVTPVEASGLLSVPAPRTVCAGCNGEMTFTYDLAERHGYGAKSDVMQVRIGGAPSYKTIYTAMTGIDDLSNVDMNEAPRLFLDRQAYDFGTVHRRTVPYVFRITASNEGRQLLHVRSVSEAEGFRCTLREGMTIAPGDELPFELQLYTDKYFAGQLHESLTIVVDDPLRPVREIKISAKIE